MLFRSGSSTSYQFDSGYVARLERSISIALDSSTKSLPLGSPGTSQTATSTVSVLTDGGGFILATNQDHALRHTDAVTTTPAVRRPIPPPPACTGLADGRKIM